MVYVKLNAFDAAVMLCLTSSSSFLANQFNLRGCLGFPNNPSKPFSLSICVGRYSKTIKSGVHAYYYDDELGITLVDMFPILERIAKERVVRYNY